MSRATRNAAGRRAAITLVGLTVVGLLVLVAVVAAVLGADSPSSGSDLSAEAPSGAVSDGLGDDAAARAALASRAMPTLPLAAAAPQALAPPAAAAPALRLPTAGGYIGDVGAGFPATGEGAVAALAALDEVGLRGGDPAVYSATYSALAAPGAPPASTTRLVGLLSSVRARAGLPATGPVPGLVIGYRVSQAQVKGVLDDGRYAVVCVLGQFDAAYLGMFVSYGVGDCQALTHAGGTWRISPGPGAARAPDAWPGSADARAAGYQELAR
jgi:hypothetical protein